MEMPDVLSAHILEFVCERLRRNWPLVLAFEIRTGRRELQRGECVAIMPYIGDNPLTNASREPLWLGKGGDMICSGGRSCDPHRIQWLQHTTFKGSSCWVESSYNGLVLASSIVAAGFILNPIHIPNRWPCARQFSATCSAAPPAFAMPPSVLHMLASACKSACSGYGAELDLVAQSSMLVAESDGCPSQFAFRSQP